MRLSIKSIRKVKNFLHMHWFGQLAYTRDRMFLHGIVCFSYCLHAIILHTIQVANLCIYVSFTLMYMGIRVNVIYLQEPVNILVSFVSTFMWNLPLVIKIWKFFLFSNACHRKSQHKLRLQQSATSTLRLEELQLVG